MKDLKIRNIYVQAISLLTLILLIIALLVSLHKVSLELTISFIIAAIIVLFITLYSALNSILLKNIEEGYSVVFRIENFVGSKKDVIYWKGKWYRLVKVSFENGINMMTCYSKEPNFMIEEKYYSIVKYLFNNDYDEFAKCISTKIINFKTSDNEIKKSN